ncbi:hypothetical protein FIBSPDRAFT_209365 [Athelia psychrophila]|uniref:Uncharacterized protein n=1 Tax=Athelia psychrophila TaxID=1759441 RepID=A0A166WQN2_9AGAM|nr:hypothetical protein FIBSPDRAFT_209365 [Fibularhizoctonia sp. CBS 109695]
MSVNIFNNFQCDARVEQPRNGSLFLQVLKLLVGSQCKESSYILQLIHSNERLSLADFPTASPYPYTVRPTPRTVYRTSHFHLPMAYPFLLTQPCSLNAVHRALKTLQSISLTAANGALKTEAYLGWNVSGKARRSSHPVLQLRGQDEGARDN